MKWEQGRRSTNVADRRGSGARIAAGGGIGAVLVAIVIALLGGDPSAVLDTGAPTQPAMDEGEEQRLADFTSVVLADTEDVWHDLFRKMGRTYQEPQLVLFRGQVESGCGIAGAAVGPFYCPPDSSVYIDLSFYRDLEQRFGAPGDFAHAYVIAHEVGHHVQNLLGISDRVHEEQQRLSKADANALSVRLELQADFFAGVWAHHAQKVRNVLEPGDIDEALGAASAIGDDRLQKRAQGRVVPDSFTHGTSAQRQAWFRRGFETGDASRGDTFDDSVFDGVSAPGATSRPQPTSPRR